MSRSIQEALLAISTLWRSCRALLCLVDVEDHAAPSSRPANHPIEMNTSAPMTPTSVKGSPFCAASRFFIASDGSDNSADDESIPGPTGEIIAEPPAANMGVADGPAAGVASVEMVPGLTRDTDGTGITGPTADLENARPMRPTPADDPSRRGPIFNDDGSVGFMTRAHRDRIAAAKARAAAARAARMANAEATNRATIHAAASIAGLTNALTEYSVGNFPPTPVQAPPHAQAPAPIVGIQQGPNIRPQDLRSYALRLPGHVGPAFVAPPADIVLGEARDRGLTRTLRSHNIPLLVRILNGEFNPLIQEFYRYWLQYDANPARHALTRGVFNHPLNWDQRMPPAEDMGSDSGSIVGDVEVTNEDVNDVLDALM